MPPQRGGRPLNQLVVDNFQQIIVPERLATVQCREGGNCYGQAKSFERGYPQRVFE